MASWRYTEEQIMGVLQKAEAGTKVAELCRTYGISETAHGSGEAHHTALTGG